MKLMIKNKALKFSQVSLIICLLLALGLVPVNQQRDNYLSKQQIEKLRLDYPLYNKSPELLSTRPLTFEEVFEGVDSVVIGYIIDDKLPNYHINLPHVSEADQAIHEKNKSLGHDQRAAFIQYKLKVEKLVAGSQVNDEILLSHNAMFKGIEPELKTGMKLLLAVSLGSGAHKGKHFFSRYGTYYIVEGNYVLPAYEDDETKQLTGASLRQLIRTIKSYRKDDRQI